MLTSERHLSPEPKPLGPASVNTEKLCVTRSYARVSPDRPLVCDDRRESELFGVSGRMRCRRGGGASSRADLRQSLLLCASFLQEQRLCSRWFADGADQEVHSAADSPQNQTGFRQNLAELPPVYKILPRSARPQVGSGFRFAPLHPTLGVCGAHRLQMATEKLSGLFCSHTAEVGLGGKRSPCGFIPFFTPATECSKTCLSKVSNGPSAATRRGGYHSYSTNTNCTQEL